MAEHDDNQDLTGRIDDAEEARATSDDSGAAAAGEYDAAEGSPHQEAPAPSGDPADVLVEDVPTQSEDPERR
ncbi:hypothetical protein KLP28_13700 [Nocardioidaceae bacterium]|nr:hypothetical protein KLP28_13700 [Nocardioidaceae bacterium]